LPFLSQNKKADTRVGNIGRVTSISISFPNTGGKIVSHLTLTALFHAPLKFRKKARRILLLKVIDFKGKVNPAKIVGPLTFL
jgi:hypothetical protein